MDKPFKVRNSPARRGYQEGFTLIEVMVGVAIFAVLSALIVGSIQSNSDRNAKLEAQRFIAVVNEVRDEALISGKTFALQMNEKGKHYGFIVLGGSEQSVPDTLLRTRHLHESVKLRWDVFEEFNEEDDEDIEDLEEQEQAQVPSQVEPRVYITALGEITPFQTRFGGDEDDFIVQLNDEGVLGFDVKPSNFF